MTNFNAIEAQTLGNNNERLVILSHDWLGVVWAYASDNVHGYDLARGVHAAELHYSQTFASAMYFEANGVKHYTFEFDHIK